MSTKRANIYLGRVGTRWRRLCRADPKKDKSQTRDARIHQRRSATLASDDARPYLSRNHANFRSFNTSANNNKLEFMSGPWRGAARRGSLRFSSSSIQLSPLAVCKRINYTRARRTRAAAKILMKIMRTKKSEAEKGASRTQPDFIGVRPNVCTARPAPRAPPPPGRV